MNCVQLQLGKTTANVFTCQDKEQAMSKSKQRLILMLSFEEIWNMYFHSVLYPPMTYNLSCVNYLLLEYITV